MKLSHKLGFVGGRVYNKGEVLSSEDEKTLKASGTKFFELKEKKAKKEKEVKDEQ